MTNDSYLSEVDTPIVVIDEQLLAANIKCYQQYCDKHSIRLRPHAKSHNTSIVADMQIKAGAVGINCQKLSEAEAISCENILIATNIVGEQKLNRLADLAKCREYIAVVSDSIEIARHPDHPYIERGDHARHPVSKVHGFGRLTYRDFNARSSALASIACQRN